MGRKVIAASLLFLSILLSLSGCDGGKGDTDQKAEEINIYFKDIVELMSMSKEEVLAWWEGNYEQMLSEGESIEKYRDKTSNMNIYFSDLVGTGKIDSIEFESAVDINGIRIGMTYGDLIGNLPQDYWEEELYMEGEFVSVLGFALDDFFVIFERVNDNAGVERIRVARGISLEAVKPLLAMSE